MRKTFHQPAHAGLVSLHLGQLALTSPLPDLDLYVRQEINCSDLNPAAVFDASCWGGLDLSDWLNHPTTGWKARTPVCTSSEDGSNCCMFNEPWTTCFLQLAHNNPSYDCSQINPQSCPNDNTLSAYMSPSIVPQTRYVVKNTYGMSFHPPMLRRHDPAHSINSHQQLLHQLVPGTSIRYQSSWTDDHTGGARAGSASRSQHCA